MVGGHKRLRRHEEGSAVALPSIAGVIESPHGRGKFGKNPGLAGGFGPCATGQKECRQTKGEGPGGDVQGRVPQAVTGLCTGASRMGRCTTAAKSPSKMAIHHNMS